MRDTILVHLTVVGPYHAHAWKHLGIISKASWWQSWHVKSVIFRATHLQNPKGQLMWDFGYAQESLVNKLSNIIFPTTTMHKHAVAHKQTMSIHDVPLWRGCANPLNTTCNMDFACALGLNARRTPCHGCLFSKDKLVYRVILVDLLERDKQLEQRPQLEEDKLQQEILQHVLLIER